MTNLYAEYPRADDEDDDKEESQEKDAERGQKNRAVQKILFDSRVCLVFGEITEKLSREVVATLLALAEEDKKKPIRMVISSPGGHVESGDAIHDVMRFIQPTVKVLGTGWVASAGAHIYLGADKEHRYCTPNTRFLLHQPLGGFGGKATEIEIEAREMLRMRERLNKIVVRETGQPLERVEKDTDRNFWMFAEEAKEYGLVSHIVDSYKDMK